MASLCNNCKALSAAAGRITRCPEHPLKSGGSSFQEHIRYTLVEKTIRGRTVQSLEPVILNKPDKGRMVDSHSGEWTARSLPTVPERVPFLWQGKFPISGGVKLRHDHKGWGPLSKASPKYEPGWWEHAIYRLDDGSK